MWWVGAALLLAVLEMVSLTLVFIMLSGGALAGAVVAVLGGPWWAQVLAAALVALLLLFALRPWLLRNWRRRKTLPETNVAALPGKTALVIVTVDTAGGRVKIDGQMWSARTEGGDPLPAGASVTVSRIQGATAIVGPLSVSGVA